MITKAQNPVFKQATLSHPVELWQPFKLANGTNEQDGVSFYVHDASCSSKKVKLVKIININNYAVNFSYQLSAASPVVLVVVPAAVSIEGTCESNDSNLKKLVVILASENNEAENKIAKEYILSHIKISKI